MRKVIVALTLLVLAAATPVAAGPAGDSGAVHTDFYGLYFPAGMPGTGTECPGLWMDPSFCILDPGDQAASPGGNLRIRDMVLYELALSWNDQGVEERKTGYDIVTANANLDETLTGPTWGTWMLYSFGGELMFTGHFNGRFENGIPAVHFVGKGVGIYEGQLLRGDVGRVPDPYNMFGTFLEPSSL
jgi:hypothetical protein